MNKRQRKKLLKKQFKELNITLTKMYGEAFPYNPKYCERLIEENYYWSRHGYKVIATS